MRRLYARIAFAGCRERDPPERRFAYTSSSSQTIRPSTVWIPKKLWRRSSKRPSRFRSFRNLQAATNRPSLLRRPRSYSATSCCRVSTPSVIHPSGWRCNRRQTVYEPDPSIVHDHRTRLPYHLVTFRILLSFRLSALSIPHLHVAQRFTLPLDGCFPTRIQSRGPIGVSCARS